MRKSESKSKNAGIMIKRTAKNKIKTIEKALKTAGGKAVGLLEERLKLWQGKL